MKWAGVIFVCASMATSLAAPSGEKSGRAFSLFSVVSFPNSECNTQMSDMKGLCVTAEECDQRNGGSASGNCASGFGVCCLTVVSDATTMITDNMTYIQNDGFPSGVGSTGTVAAVQRAYRIEGAEGVQQIRLDFVNGVFKQPAAGAATGCTGLDVVSITSPSSTRIGVGSLCGTLTGQHIYVHNDGANPAAIVNINTDATALTGGRTWKILVRMIEAGSSSQAPEGCLQYFMGSTGTIKSFNDLSGTAAGQTLPNLNYNACIRAEAGSNCITFREARTGTATPDAFNVANVAAAIAASVRGLAQAAASPFAPTTCTSEHILIRGTTVNEAAGAQFCGGLLNPVTAATISAPVTSSRLPFELGVFSDGATNKVAATRFEINYSQSSC